MFSKKVISQSVAVLAVFAMMMTAAVDNYNEIRAAKNEELANAQLTAGIVGSMSQMAASTASMEISKEDAQLAAVAAGYEQDEWQDRLMADVEEYIYVRTAPSEDADVAGKLRAGNIAEITSIEGEWFGITSGNLKGYVYAAYCLTGSDAEELANSVITTYAVSKSAGTRVRSEASADGKILTNLAQGDKVKVRAESEEIEGWIPVTYNDQNGYVSADLVEVSRTYTYGITVEEEQAAIKAAEEAKAKAAADAEARKNYLKNLDDVTLLAALIQAEAGYEPAEGKLAVGAVVVNRVHSGSYPNTVYGVIYQSGQFSPAGSGRVATLATKGPSASCIEAAQQALSGSDNTGGALHFRPTSSGKSGTVIGHQVFY